MLGSVDEANTMARIGEKSGSCRHGGEMTVFPFGAQILLDVTLHRQQADQGLGLMRVELIGDEDPGGLWIDLDGLDGAAKSVSVRVGPMLGVTTCPLATSRLAIKLCVPCRSYSNSWRST